MGKKKNSVSVYLHDEELNALEGEVIIRSKRDKDALITPKDVSVGLLIRACVDYVIDNGKLKELIPNQPRRPNAVGAVWVKLK